MLFEDFLFLALVAILFNGAEPLWPSWISDRQSFSSFWSSNHPVAKLRFGSRRPKVWEEMSKIDLQDGSCGSHLGFSIDTFS